jgi:tetratricopeptide (TPR) repeat protein
LPKVSFEEAVKAYKKAIGINSDKDEAYYNMGGVYTMLNKFEKAIKAYNLMACLKALIASSNLSNSV